MIVDLSGYIFKEDKTYWPQFIEMMKIHLKPADLKGDNSNLFDICEKLLNAGVISYGEYGFLIETFETMKFMTCTKIVKCHLQQMKQAKRLKLNQDLMLSTEGSGGKLKKSECGVKRQTCVLVSGHSTRPPILQETTHDSQGKYLKGSYLYIYIYLKKPTGQYVTNDSQENILK